MNSKKSHFNKASEAASDSETQMAPDGKGGIVPVELQQTVEQQVHESVLSVGSSSLCPLCHGSDAVVIFQDPQREFLRCPNCELTFVPSKFHLSLEDEKGVYDQHQNSPKDNGYRKFLSRIFQPIHDRVRPGSCGLDFGSGPGPTLSVMFTEAGHAMEIYDPYYSPNQAPLAFEYDFVTASEVAEHFCDPAASLKQLWSCVKPSGLLGIMTKRAHDKESFANWHYKNDPTHVSFFSRRTFEWLAEHWQADVTFVGPDVVVLQRGTESCRH